MIQRLNDSQNSIEYTDKHGNTTRASPFEEELYTALTQRITDQIVAAGDNVRNRKNHEDAVRNLQISIDAGRLTLADAVKKLPGPPVYRVFPDDPNMPEDDGEWDPPLLSLHDLQGVVKSHPIAAQITQDHVDKVQELLSLAS